MIEPAQLDTGRAFADEVRHRGAEVLARDVSGVPECPDDEHRRPRQLDDQLAQQLERRRLGPVQVVDEQGDRPGLSRPAHDVGGCLEQQVAAPSPGRRRLSESGSGTRDRS